MALPSSGTISFQNFNTDRGLSSTATVDLDTAAIAYGIPTKPHGMNEFYGLSVGAPPPPPPPPPPVTYYYHYVRPCAGGTPIYIVRHTSFLATSTAVTLYGPGGCWEVTGVGGTPHDYTVSTTYADCAACNTTPPPPPPPSLSISNGSVTCSSGGNFTSTLSGGTGTYDWVAIDTSFANVSNAIQGISGTRVAPSGGSSHSWISLSNNTYYTAVMDSSGTYQIQTTGVVVNCVAPPPPPPPPPPPTVYYYNATRCDDSTNYIIYGGTNYYGTGVVVISGTTTYCYTIQNEVGVQAYVDTVGSSVANCGNASCYVTPPPPPPPPPPSVTVSFTTGCSGGQTYVNLTATTTNQTTTPSYSWLVTLDSGTDFTNSANYISPQNNSGLANGSYYVAAYDTANGDYDVICCTANQGCSPPPPPPPPPGPTYYYNNAYRNTCNGGSPCTDDGVEVVLRSTSPLSNGSWYSDGSKSYQPYGSTSGPSYGVDIDPYIYTEAGSCETACNNY